jgi:hypothetical protein
LDITFVPFVKNDDVNIFHFGMDWELSDKGFAAAYMPTSLP